MTLLLLKESNYQKVQVITRIYFLSCVYDIVLGIEPATDVNNAHSQEFHKFKSWPLAICFARIIVGLYRLTYINIMVTRILEKYKKKIQIIFIVGIGQFKNQFKILYHNEFNSFSCVIHILLRKNDKFFVIILMNDQFF